ncbi:MAG: GH25 family lysozyme [Anaerolineae bacterium]
MERVPGIDVSRWQGEIDWQKVVEAEYRFAVIRASIGDYYADPRFDENWEGARAAGLLLSAYHVLAPNASADAQAKHFFKILGEREPDLPLVLDVERNDGAVPGRITTSVRDALRLVEEHSGRRPIIYTARWFWNRFVLSSERWQDYDLWVASYTSAPILPRGWEAWRFWQFSESGNVPGVGSHSTDLNWYNGSYDSLLRYARNEEAEPEVTGKRWRFRVTIPKLNVRSGPGTDYKDLGDLHDGDVIEALRLTGDDVWVEFEPGKWAALSLEGERYMAMVLEPEEEDEEPDESDPT